MQLLENAAAFAGKKTGEIVRKKVENFELDIFGLENLEALKNGPFILASNHNRPTSAVLEQSQLGPDSFVLERIVLEQNHQDLMTLAKADSGNWLFGNNKPGKALQKQIEDPFRVAVQSIGMIPVSRNPGSLNRDLFQKVKETINADNPILIFPEGYWKDEFDPNAELEPGAAYFALKNKVPILPAYINNATEWKAGQEVDVYFGEAIDPIGEDKNSLTEIIRESIAELQEEHYGKNRTEVSSLLEGK